MSNQKIITLLTIAFLGTTVLPVLGQDAENDQPQTLREQYLNLKEQSNNYQNYKVVNEYSMDQFWASVSDSLKQYNQEVNTLQHTVDTLRRSVATLQQSVATRDTSLAEQKDLIDNMTFLGIEVSKSTYRIISWSIIGFLLILLIITYYRFKSSNRITVTTRRDYEQLSEEFEAHRQRTRENESRIKRELQNEINRVEELREMLGSGNN